MYVERFIDYMQFSARFKEAHCIEAQFEPVAPVKFYKRGYRDSLGIRYYFGAAKGNKCLVIASGKPLENLRSLRNDREILRWALDVDATFSRIDLAVTQWNVADGLVVVSNVARWFTDGLITSPLCKWGCKEISELFIESQRQVQTLYIGDMGKRAELGIFRAYDKGIELDIGEYMATRLELELKREKAHATALRLSESGDIAGNFRASFDVKHKDFVSLMDAEAVSTKRGKAKVKIEENEEMKKRWDWLINQVAPALKSAVLFDEKNGYGERRLQAFISASGLGEKMRKDFNERIEAEVGKRIGSTLDFD
jgi:DNA relaxase NicK